MFWERIANRPLESRGELPNSKSPFYGEFPNPTRVPISTANTCEVAGPTLAKCDQSANPCRPVLTTPVVAISTHLATCNQTLAVVSR